MLVVGVRVSYEDLWKEAPCCARCQKVIYWGRRDDFKYCPFCGAGRNEGTVRVPACHYDREKAMVGPWHVMTDPTDNRFVYIGAFLLNDHAGGTLVTGMMEAVKSDMWEGTKGEIPPEWSDMVRVHQVTIAHPVG